jgi:16S rRNA (cytosine1402-N4)-methyltransferase
MAARTGLRSPAAPGHLPVMLGEVLDALAPADGGVIADGTFGGGGYARAILKAADCSVIGIDRDLDAIVRAERLAAEFPRLVPLLGRFGDMDTLLPQAGWASVDGVVLDIGVSSFQIDEAARGFSFMKDGPLDMRMGASGPSAADVVNRMAERDLSNVIFRLGEERHARRIARSIVQRRAAQPFETTADLASFVETAVGGRRGARAHPDLSGHPDVRQRRTRRTGPRAEGGGAGPEARWAAGGGDLPFAGRPAGQAMAARTDRRRAVRLAPLAADAQGACAELRVDHKQGVATV